MTVPQITLGIDISSTRLDAYAYPAGRAHGVANTAAGIARLVGWARELGAFVVLEATAPFDQGLIRALERAGLAFHRANPKRARDFARSAGFLAKTDAVDARMLALYGTTPALRPTAPVAPERLELQALSTRRDQLVEMRKSERIRLKGVSGPISIQSLQTVIALLDAQIAALDTHIATALARAPDLARDAAILRSGAGVGPVCASVLLAFMPELGTLNRRAVALLAGLAPIARDSGAMRGKRYVGGGRKRVRDALYMASLAAIRIGRWKQAYDHLRALGKAPKQAIIAIARKLLIALNAAIRDQNPLNNAPQA